MQPLRFENVVTVPPSSLRETVTTVLERYEDVEEESNIAIEGDASGRDPETNASRPTPGASTGRSEGLVRSRGLLTFLVLLGVALRVWTYVSNTSLWLDEILLSRNILELPMGELLTRPLYLDQVAPRGFLLVEKLAVLAFGPNELALRLFPFLCSVAGIFLFRRLAERTLDGLAVPFAVMLCAIGLPFIKYTAEVKQYGADATVTILLLLLAVELRAAGASARQRLVTGAVGFVVIWFSQASVLVMGGIGLAFAVEWLITRNRQLWRTLSLTISMWAAASIIAVVAGIRSMTASTREFMDDFWRGGFLPLPFELMPALRWFWDQSLSFFTDPTLLRVRWPVLFLALTVAGFVALWRRRRDVSTMLIGPIVVSLLAAVAHQFPFRGRLMMYLVPGLLLALAAGAEWVRRSASQLHPVAGMLLMLILAWPVVAAIAESPPPYEIEHHRTMLGYLQQHRRPGDVVYVFPLTRIGTLFYGPRYGLQPGDFVTSVCDRNETRPYIRDVDRFRGVPRLWFIATQARPFRLVRPAVQQYLGTIGVKRDSLVLPSLTMGQVSIELYDLSDPMRLRAADAASFPVPPMPTNPRPGCRP